MPYFPYTPGPGTPPDPKAVLVWFAIMAAVLLVALGISLWHSHGHHDQHRAGHQH
jgi:hypothetical protein